MKHFTNNALRLMHFVICTMSDNFLNPFSFNLIEWSIPILRQTLLFQEVYSDTYLNYLQVLCYFFIES